MHIVDGYLPWPALAAGAAATAGGVAMGLRRLDYDRVPRVAVMAAAFFVASLIHVPIAGSSAHLVLSGLTGLLLGWASFPAILVALLLQAILFGFGGLTVLGVNTFNMAVPAVVCYYVFSGPLRRARSPAAAFGLGFGAGALGIVLGVALVALLLLTRGKGFVPVALLMTAAHAGLAVVEGFVTGWVAVFLHRVQPALLEPPLLAAIAKGQAHA